MWVYYKAPKHQSGESPELCNQYRGTSLTRKRTPLEIYRRPMPGIVCLGFYEGPRGVSVFLWARYPCTTSRPLCVGAR